MKNNRICFLLLLHLLLVTLLGACSKTSNPLVVDPIFNDSDGVKSTDIELPSMANHGNRQIIAICDMVIDPVNETCEIRPSTRQSDYHFPLNAYFPNVLKITGFGWTPTFWADMKLTHPFPGSGIDAFDPRIIGLLPCNGSNNFSYPIFDAYGNNQVVLEPDGYTRLFDDLNPSISGNANPFKAYFKGQNYRRWSSTGYTSETQRWYMNLFGFGGPIVYTLVVDVSTNYPASPTPIVDNAQEPVEIAVEVGEGMTPEGGEAPINVTVMDWQGMDNVHVTVESPHLFDGTLNLAYVSQTGEHQYLYTETLRNFLMAPEGDYGVLVSAFDTVAGFETYSEGVASVKSSLVLNPVDITPDSLNFNPQNVYIEDNIAYVAGGRNGLHIFDITNPTNPDWIRNVSIDGNAVELLIGDGYALVCAEEGGLVIVDVDPIRTAHVVDTVATVDYARDVDAWAGYAYVADDWGGLSIVNIINPASAFLVSNAYLGGQAVAVKLAGEYAYVANNGLGLQIVYVGDIENPYLINTVYVGGFEDDIALWGGYAYIANWDVNIVDIYPPESAYWVNTIDVPGRAEGIHIDSNVAYVAGWDGNLSLLDASSPYGSIFQYVTTPGDCDVGVHVSNGMACVVDDQAGLHVIDVTNPNYPYRTSTTFTPGNALGAFVDNEGYAYIADGYGGLMSVDVDPPTPEYVMAYGNTPGEAKNVVVDNSYLFVADGFEGLAIFMMTSPGIFTYVKNIDTSGFAYDICVQNGYLYLADGSSGMDIFNVMSPQETYYVATASTYMGTVGVDVDGIYAYVAELDDGIQIFDISNPASPFEVKHVVFPYLHSASDIFYKDGYAYVADDYAATLKVIDVDPVSSASIVHSVYFTDEAMAVFVQDDYAYIACWEAGLQIVDISSPTSAYIAASAPTPNKSAWGVFVDGIYAYVSDYRGGFRIIQVWQ